MIIAHFIIIHHGFSILVIVVSTILTVLLNEMVALNHYILSASANKQLVGHARVDLTSILLDLLSSRDIIPSIDICTTHLAFETLIILVILAILVICLSA